MGVRRNPTRAASATERGGKTSRLGRKLPAEAFDDHDEVDQKVVEAAQERADKILKKGRWVVVDGYVGKK
jgi:hypothetical protein